MQDRMVSGSAIALKMKLLCPWLTEHPEN